MADQLLNIVEMGQAVVEEPRWVETFLRSAGVSSGDRQLLKLYAQQSSSIVCQEAINTTMQVSALLSTPPAACPRPFVQRTHATRSHRSIVWRASCRASASGSSSTAADFASDPPTAAHRRRQVLSLGAATLALSLSSK